MKTDFYLKTNEEEEEEEMLYENETISCINHGDTTWVLVSSILVLSMMPALAFFEGLINLFVLKNKNKNI